MTLQQEYEKALFEAQIEEDKELIEHYLSAIERLGYKLQGKENKPSKMESYFTKIDI